MATIQPNFKCYSIIKYNTIQYNTIQYNTIQHNTENFYSAGILGVAKFKGASSQKSIRQKTYVQRKTIIVIQRSGSQTLLI